MSRFFDALQEAGRSSQPGSERLPADEPVAPDARPAAMPPVVAEVAEEAEAALAAEPHAPKLSRPVDPRRPAPAAAQQAAAEELLDFVASPLPKAHADAEPLGREVATSIDAHTRLIPHAADGVVVECYRRLRTKIIQQQNARPFRTMVVTSPGPQEGKTITALNLALSFAMLPSFRVLVVDGDLRRGNIGKWMGVEDCAGLSDWIEGTARLEDVVLKGQSSPMHFMVRGRSKLAPAELLHSPQLPHHFRRLAEHFDLVVVDSPPVNLVSDVQLLARSCDAVLLVGRAFSTTQNALQQAAQDLSAYRLVGSVLNGGTRGKSYRHYGEY